MSARPQAARATASATSRSASAGIAAKRQSVGSIDVTATTRPACQDQEDGGVAMPLYMTGTDGSNPFLSTSGGAPAQTEQQEQDQQQKTQQQQAPASPVKHVRTPSSAAAGMGQAARHMPKTKSQADIRKEQTRSSEVAELKAQLARSEAKNSQLQGQITRLEKHLELSQAQIRELNVETESVMEAKERETQELAHLREQLRDMLANQEETESYLANQLTAVEAQLTVAQQRLEQVTREKDSLTEQLIESKLDVALSKEEVIEVKHMFLKTQESYGDLQDQARQVAALKRQLEAVQVERDAAKGKYKVSMSTHAQKLSQEKVREAKAKMAAVQQEEKEAKRAQALSAAGGAKRSMGLGRVLGKAANGGAKSGSTGAAGRGGKQGKDEGWAS